MGDFKIHLLNYESHNETNDFINVSMVSHYLLPHILHPTRVTDHSATVIDNIFSNNTSHKTVGGKIITRSLIISHSLLFLTNLLLITNHAKGDFSDFDEREFIAGFSSQSMDFLHDASVSIDFKFDQFYLSLSSYVDRHAPVKKMTKKDLQLHSIPWITPKIYHLIKYHEKLLRKLNRKFSNSNI